MAGSVGWTVTPGPDAGGGVAGTSVARGAVVAVALDALVGDGGLVGVAAAEGQQDAGRQRHAAGDVQHLAQKLPARKLPFLVVVRKLLDDVALVDV